MSHYEVAGTELELSADLFDDGATQHLNLHMP
jgi:hypothetical protein